MERVTTLRLSIIALSLGLLLADSPPKAQQAKLPRVGILLLGGPGPSSDSLRQGFTQLGYVDGQNVITEFRFVRGQFDRAPEIAAELVRLDVDVIVAVGAIGVQAARKATSKIPIVFSAVIDPVASGYAATLERPAGNITGITSFDPQQASKQLEILKEINPKLSRVAILSDQDIPRAPDGWNPLEKANDAAARALGLQPHWFRMKGPKPDLQEAFTAMISERAEALLILEVPITILHFNPIAALAAKNRLPTMFPGGWANDGLITYGTSILDATPQIPGYVDKILKGAEPGELPIEVITRRELIINLKTAQEIGVTIPSDLLKLADRVIQ